MLAGSETGGASDPVREVLADFAPPPELDRYVVVEIIGRGGLGLVYSAWDPELERRVAVKLIRARARRQRKHASARFLREARAMAKLSHPNVVTVYDVGTYDDGGPSAFVVMELIAGQTLTRWLGERQRRVSEIIRTFLQAGEGLAAAHAQGLVHRDFKPDNVMVTDDGAVKVLDFGLALMDGHSQDSADRGSTPSVDLLESSPVRLTETGLVMGTPRYMAPEQHAAKGVGPAADQYAFCLCLLGALRGGEVFEATGMRDLVRLKRAGKIRAPDEHDRTPRAVRKILLRGLRPNPRERWPSMAALLDALGRRQRRRWILPGLGAIGLVTAASFAIAQPEAPACETGASRVAQAWSPARRAELAPRLEQVSPTDAPAAVRALEAWAATEIDGWAPMVRDACRAVADERLDPAAFDRRMQCLRVMAAAREELLDLLEDAGPKDVSGLPERLAGLAPLSACEDDERLAARTVLPSTAEDRETVVRLREQLQRARTLAEAAKLDEARVGVESALRDAQALGYEPAVAEALVSLGRLETDAGEFEAALAAYQDAAALAESCRHDYAAARAGAGATFLLATRMSRPEEAALWLGRAKASLERAGAPPSLDLRVTLGEVALLYERQDYAAATAIIEEFIARFEPASAADRLQVTVLLGNLAITHQMAGDYPAAIKRLEEAIALRSELLGPKHPKIAPLRYNLGNTLTKAGRFPDAVEQYEQAIASIEERLGPGHFEAGNYYLGRGVALKKQGKYDAARKDYERALAVLREKAGPESPQTATAIANLGNLEKRTGNRARALELHREALAIRERKLGTEHDDVASSLDDIGSLLRAEGEVEEGLRKHERAMAIRTKVHGEKHPARISSMVLLGNANLEAEHVDEALAWYEKAESLQTEVGEQSNSRALILLGRGNVAMKRDDPKKAVQLFESTVEAYAAAGAAPQRIGSARFELAKAQFQLGEASRAADAVAQARVELRDPANPTSERLAELEEWAEENL